MAQFTYRARTAEGALTRGTLRAFSPDRAAALLRSHGLLPVDIQPLAGEGGLLSRNVFGGPLSRKDLILFSRELSSMIQAGVPVLQSLRAMQPQIEKKSFHNVVRDISYGVESGESLSAALSRHPKAFNPFFLGVVRTGEASGRLSQSLEILAGQIEQEYAFLQKIRAALIYPIFVVVVVLMLSFIMLVFVLPQLTTLFSEANVTLPLPTRVLLTVATTLRQFWWLLLISLFALAVVARSYLKTPEGRYALSSASLRLPLIRQLLRKVYLARLTSILQTLFESGVPVLQSLALARDAMGNQVYRRILSHTATAVRDGASLSSVWQHEPFIPPLLTTMVGVGEKSGNVSRAFGEAHRFFQRDVDAILATIAVLIEPLLIVLLGIGVGFIVAAVLLPIYNLVLVL